MTDTHFLPAQRTDEATVRRQAAQLADFEALNLLGGAIPNGLVAINEQRQIVYANDAFRATVRPRKQIYGLRIGEALDCERSDGDPAGCGTTRFCVQCGAARAISRSLNGQQASDECRVVRRTDVDGEPAFDLRVVATPFTHEDERFILFSASDISHEKRRRVLERVFFHDVNNTAGLIHGVAELLTTNTIDVEAERPEFQQLLVAASARLIDEIETHRQLMEAEAGDLQLDPQPFNTEDLLGDLVALFQSHEFGRTRHLRLAEDSASLIMVSDLTLLSRVLGNMIKNALEATTPGDTIAIGCSRQENDVRFWVKNPGFMPRDVQMQLFQRSFSTKGTGRGLGTYSMKMLSERYLNGVVSFVSTPEDGTTFYGLYPLRLLP